MPVEQLTVLVVFLFFAFINWLMRARNTRRPIERGATWQPELEAPLEPEPEPHLPPSRPLPAAAPGWPPPEIRATVAAEPPLVARAPVVAVPPPAPRPPPRPGRRPAELAAASGIVPKDKAALRRAVALTIVLGPPRSLAPPEV